MLRLIIKLTLVVTAIMLYSFQSLMITEAAQKRYYNNKGRQWGHYKYISAKKKPFIQNKAIEEAIRRPQSVNSTSPSTSSMMLANQILQTGEKYIGTPYKQRILNYTLDCSGFMRFIFAQHGIKLPGGSYNQVNVGKTINKSELQKGDLVFFKLGTSSRIGHVAVYAGNNQVLHTYNPGVKYDSLDAPWLKAGFVTAKRIL